MKTVKYLLLTALCTLMFSGRALIKNNSNQDINTIESKESANFEAYGAERINPLGTVATKSDERGSAVYQLKYAAKGMTELERPRDRVEYLEAENAYLKKIEGPRPGRECRDVRYRAETVRGLSNKHALKHLLKASGSRPYTQRTRAARATAYKTTASEG